MHVAWRAASIAGIFQIFWVSKKRKMGLPGGSKQNAKRWSAVSDGGEDQGAEEVTVHGAEEGEESSR